MLTIWGRANSMNVQKVLWAAEECGLRFERIDAGRGFGGTESPEYLAMNPNKLVPTIIDGDRGVTQWTFTATRPDGTKISSAGCDLFVFRDGLISVKDSYRKQATY